MCTLTVLRTGEDCIITMTRDERRERSEPGVLHIENSLVYPLDARSNGTWFGLTSDGQILAILNGYHQPHLPDRISRGEIIPGALRAFSPVRWMSELDASVYNPFDLFWISRTRAWHFQWNGKNSAEGYLQREINTGKHFMFSSSSFMTEDVLAHRHALFGQWLASHRENAAADEREAMARSVLNDFHLLQEPGRATHAVLMEREFSHSKSITQAVLSKEGQSVSYFPEVLARGLESGVRAKWQNSHFALTPFLL